jgi:hypothetical protein
MISFSGVYFFHRSFLIEVSDTWLNKGEISKSGELFRQIVFSSFGCAELISCDRSIKELITCDRTKLELSKSKYTLTCVPAVFDLIEERSLPDGNEHLGDDEYSLKVASFRRIDPTKVRFIVSDDKKDEIIKLAKEKGYTLEIVSTKDFN